MNEKYPCKNKLNLTKNFEDIFQQAHWGFERC